MIISSELTLSLQELRLEEHVVSTCISTLWKLYTSESPWEYCEPLTGNGQFQLSGGYGKVLITANSTIWRILQSSHYGEFNYLEDIVKLSLRRIQLSEGHGKVLFVIGVFLRGLWQRWWWDLTCRGGSDSGMCDTWGALVCKHSSMMES